MGTKVYWPLCDGGQVEEEFYDMATQSLVMGSGYVKRYYVRVENWD